MQVLIRHTSYKFDPNDIVDIRRINSMAVKAANTGMIIVGGGLIKHHICNANLMVSDYRAAILVAVFETAFC